MITKRLIYEPVERVESAISELQGLAIAAGADGQFHIQRRISEIISKDLEEAKSKLEYVQELAS